MFAISPETGKTDFHLLSLIINDLLFIRGNNHCWIAYLCWDFWRSLSVLLIRVIIKLPDKKTIK